MFEFVNTKKYLCWSLKRFIEEMKLFHANRTLILISQIGQEGITSDEAMKQLQLKKGVAYNIFVNFCNVGGDDFFQEILTSLSFIDFLGHNEVEGVAFPVKETCPKNIDLIQLKNYIENDSEYDFLIKKSGTFIKFQLKSCPEQYISEFNSDYFIKDIISLTTKKYIDTEMVLVYLLQPSIQRTSTKEFYEMFDQIRTGIGSNLLIRNIFFVGRIDLETFEYIQVYQEVVRHQIDINKTLASEIRRYKPF